MDRGVSGELADTVDYSIYEPQAIVVKKNLLAGPKTFGLVIIIGTAGDTNARQFYTSVELVVEDVTILADSGNSAVVFIGPQGNVNFPLAAGASYRTSKVDINQIWYNTNGTTGKIYFMYSGCPSITTET